MASDSTIALMAVETGLGLHTTQRDAAARGGVEMAKALGQLERLGTPANEVVPSGFTSSQYLSSYRRAEQMLNTCYTSKSGRWSLGP